MPTMIDSHPEEDKALHGEPLELLYPLMRVFEMIHRPRGFSLQIDLRIPSITFDDIRKRKHRTPAVEWMVKSYIEKHSQEDAMIPILEALKVAIDAVCRNIRSYVLRYGPRAYVDLYTGRVPTDSKRLGIGAMLQNFAEGKDIATGRRADWLSPVEAIEKFRHIDHNILDMPTGPLVYVLDLGVWKKCAFEWTRAYENIVDAKIIEARRAYFFGEGGMVEKLLLLPMKQFTEEIESFVQAHHNLPEANG